MLPPAVAHLWAKSDPYLPLWQHLLDVAAVCRALLPIFGPVPGLPDEWVCFLAGIHDVGKADPEFQIKDPDLGDRLRANGIPVADRQSGFRHEARSAEWITDFLCGEAGWSPRAFSPIGLAITGHHGNFGAGSNECWTGTPESQRFWQEVRDELGSMLRSVTGAGPLKLDRFENASVTGLLLTALVVLSDWIASNPELYGPALPGDPADPPNYYASACGHAERVVRPLEFGESEPAPVTDGAFRTLFSLERFPAIREPRPLQRRLECLALAGELPPGLLIVEDRMGEGKSEAALYVADHWRRTAGRAGTYIALPTAATSNQMHARYREFLEKTRPVDRTPRLIHGMAWLMDDLSPSEGSVTFSEEPQRDRWASLDWFRSTRRALLAPEGVGTVDQALMAALNVRFGFLRLLGLRNKTLIVDEVHAYDEYMTVILERLLNWCRALRIPVVLLSATLSRRQKLRLTEAYGATLPVERAADYPLVTLAPLDREARAVPVDLQVRPPAQVSLQPHAGILNDPTRTADLAVRLVAAGGCLCVLMNTVGAAQDVYRRLSEHPGLPAGTELLLFHARFRAGARADREKRVVDRFGRLAGRDGRPARPERAILVATQVVEQSLDVDFDVMITQVAPIDLLLQRMGRMHRHENRCRHGHDNAVLHVLLPADERDLGPSARVYDELEPLLRSWALVARERIVRCPQDFRSLIESCYGEEPVPPGPVDGAQLEVARKVREDRRSSAEREARRSLLPEPAAESFKPALELAIDEAEEGERANRMKARTRLGDETARVLVLHDEGLERLLASPGCPPPARLRELLREQVSVPLWWMAGRKDATTGVLRPPEPADGYAPIASGPLWLPHHRVLRLRGGCWRGTDVHSRPVSIHDDEKLGLFLTHEEAANDADV